MSNNDEFLWVEKYRPQTIEECILPKQLKDVFQEFVNQKNVPNLILAGGAGVGKTTVAKAMLEELDCDYIVINGSLNAGIDVLRHDITNFASSVSFKGGRKYVIIDEADYLSADRVQPAFRNFMEEYSGNCGFIFTCNYKNRLIGPLQSRCSVVEFHIDKNDRTKLALQFMKRVCSILDERGVQYEKPAIATAINRWFPDWRRVLNELQRYAANGEITEDLFSGGASDNFSSLISALKDKNWPEVRKWVGENSNMDTSTLFRHFYDNASDVVKQVAIPQLILHMAEYQYKAAFVANQEINLAAFFIEVMADCF